MATETYTVWNPGTDVTDEIFDPNAMLGSDILSNLNSFTSSQPTSSDPWASSYESQTDFFGTGYAGAFYGSDGTRNTGTTSTSGGETAADPTKDTRTYGVSKTVNAIDYGHASLTAKDSSGKDAASFKLAVLGVSGSLALPVSYERTMVARFFNMADVPPQTVTLTGFVYDYVGKTDFDTFLSLVQEGCAVLRDSFYQPKPPEPQTLVVEGSTYTGYLQHVSWSKSPGTRVIYTVNLTFLGLVHKRSKNTETGDTDTPQADAHTINNGATQTVADAFGSSVGTLTGSAFDPSTFFGTGDISIDPTNYGTSSDPWTSVYTPIAEDNAGSIFPTTVYPGIASDTVYTPSYTPATTLSIEAIRDTDTASQLLSGTARSFVYSNQGAECALADSTRGSRLSLEGGDTVASWSATLKAATERYADGRIPALFGSGETFEATWSRVAGTSDAPYVEGHTTGSLLPASVATVRAAAESELETALGTAAQTARTVATANPFTTGV